VAVISGRTWQLSMTNAVKEWTSVATFGTVTAAARRIRDIEGYSSTGIGVRSVSPVSSVNMAVCRWFARRGRNPTGASTR
jgi:hypothetical protein